MVRFDVRRAGGSHHETILPEEVLASIAAYYAQVTTAARPMNRLIATVMLTTLAAIIIEILHASPAIANRGRSFRLDGNCLATR